jgi:hypothetical protein
MFIDNVEFTSALRRSDIEMHGDAAPTEFGNMKSRKAINIRLLRSQEMCVVTMACARSLNLEV